MKIKRQRSLVVVTVLAAAMVSAFPLHAAIEHRTPSVLLEGATTQLASTWSEIWDRLRRQEVPGGSRGRLNQSKNVCAVVPGMLIDKETDEATSLQIWGLNPVFVWQEEWSHIKVLHSRTHEVLLSQELDSEARHLAYSDVEDAIPLEPGGSYYWQLSQDGPAGPMTIFGETSFRTLHEENRLELETALAEINASEDALSKRVKFFADEGLWADVVREVYTADELPADLVALKDEIAGHDFCAQPSGD
ncbi:hypothetical protein SPB21_02250 [Leptothoe sp. ISB3NOV94-8A]